MAAYVDIHAHILPGIDDGPDDLERSLEMARSAAASGIGTIASTPHLRSDFPDVHVLELADRCRRLQGAIDQEGIPIRVVCGAEASLTWALGASDEELELASYGQGGTDLLVETPTAPVGTIGGALYELRAKGYRITLAHPERSTEFQRNEEALRDLVDQGVLLQVNAESLLGAERGSRVRRLGHSLVADGLVHALASDGHRADRWRPVTQLAEAVATASRTVGPARAEWMVNAGPAAILEGNDLPDPPAIVAQQRRVRLFGRRS